MIAQMAQQFDPRWPSLGVSAQNIIDLAEDVTIHLKISSKSVHNIYDLSCAYKTNEHKKRSHILEENYMLTE